MPNSSSSVMIQAYFRAEPPDSQVRLWIQGEVGGLPYLRRSEFKVASGLGIAGRSRDRSAGGGAGLGAAQVRDVDARDALDR